MNYPDPTGASSFAVKGVKGLRKTDRGLSFDELEPSPARSNSAFNRIWTLVPRFARNDTRLSNNPNGMRPDYKWLALSS